MFILVVAVEWFALFLRLQHRTRNVKRRATCAKGHLLRNVVVCHHRQLFGGDGVVHDVFVFRHFIPSSNDDTRIRMGMLKSVVPIGAIDSLQPVALLEQFDTYLWSE